MLIYRNLIYWRCSREPANYDGQETLQPVAALSQSTKRACKLLRIQLYFMLCDYITLHYMLLHYMTLYDII